MISSLVLALALQTVQPVEEPAEAMTAAEATAEAVANAEAAAIDAVNSDGTADGESAGASGQTKAVLPPPPPEPDIPRDTPVRLMVLNEVSTKEHKVGHKFKLRVDAPVLVDGNEVVPVGAIAWGELLSAEKSGNIGKSGKLSARLLYLDLDGREIPIDGDTEADGKSGKGETILGVLSVGVFGLFAKGNNAKLKAGEKMTAFISEDVFLDETSDAGY